MDLAATIMKHLEQIAVSVPAEMADEFADFLLNELNHDKRPANRKRPDFDHPGCILAGYASHLANWPAN